MATHVVFGFVCGLCVFSGRAQPYESRGRDDPSGKVFGAGIVVNAMGRGDAADAHRDHDMMCLITDRA